jgi:predicted nuclease with RNAse H fold
MAHCPRQRLSGLHVPLSETLVPPPADYVIGVDLAGPGNAAETAIAVFQRTRDTLRHVASRLGVDDAEIADIVTRTAAEGSVAVGLDAPLSYNPGGGLRPSDQSLREALRGHGLRVSSVMPPTLNRMAYLTLRGLAVARWLSSLDGANDVRIVEVHPGAALGLGGAPVADVQAFKKSRAACLRLVQWMESAGLIGVPDEAARACHSVAACAAALGAWKWSDGRSAWHHPAEPPRHPFDFAC